MAQRELYSSLNAGKIQAVKPQVVSGSAGSVESSAIDLAGYNSALVEYSFGTSGDTLSGSLKSTGTLTECDTSGGTYAAATNIVGTLPVVDDAAEDDTVYLVAYLGPKRYIKVGVTKTGTHTNGMPTAITVFRAHKRALNT